MAEIWIKEERVSKKFLDELGHYISLDGELDIAYFIAADGEDYVEENKNLLLDFLFFQNKYPLFISFIVYEDQTDEYITFLKENKIDFTLNYLEEKELIMISLETPISSTLLYCEDRRFKFFSSYIK